MALRNQKSRQCGILEQLLAAAAELQARPWCVSQAGFTPDALTFATDSAILVSNGEDLAALAKLAQRPGGKLAPILQGLC